MESVSATTLRIIILVIGILILIGIYFFGRPRQSGNGRRQPFRGRGGARVEPVLGEAEGGPAAVSADRDVAPEQGELDAAMERELDRLGREVAASRTPVGPPLGERPLAIPVDRIVTLYLVARDGEAFHGSDIVVAAEKVGLRFGAMHVFHRLADGRPDAGPVFSMANMVKPGDFDMNGVSELETPGVTFFITLPGPLPALDSWEPMLPSAQRVAELLGGELLDEERNALGRQRIAGLRDELRAWDRQHEGAEIDSPPRRH